MRSLMNKLFGAPTKPEAKKSPPKKKVLAKSKKDDEAYELSDLEDSSDYERAMDDLSE